MSRLAPHLRPETEREIEDSIRELFLRAGWYALKTEAGMVARGQRGLRKGHLPNGFPDLTMLCRLPGSPLALAALIEVKTETGELRPSQVKCHGELRACGLSPQIIRDADEARGLIAEAQRLSGLLRRAIHTTGSGEPQQEQDPFHLQVNI
ncbi:VRR-NUC domain-containing protein [Deinococcus sp. Leaf326]|uniref:VRR-NUC domain-containing protein n=1 Tax=Deinococcus sp. Leaf326 TaxID=1736338 RepID=UPI0006FE922B|nr:VRR-NUC domain-containing protein [Deinococcus sp. Leaf326]KQR33141.1 hypothetical protein ASF71_16760 [Deinococcus sp. Leaf326]